MSDALYPTRLEWDGRQGLARHDGVQILLQRSPTTFAEVHYTPGIQAQVRERAVDPRRDMTAQEVASAQAWLVNMATNARQATGQVAA